jgi:hypothetical protein
VSPTPAPRNSSSGNKRLICKAIQDFVASDNEELGFKAGDYIVFRVKDECGWAQGYIIQQPTEQSPSNPRIGWFPLSHVQQYVQEVSEEGSAMTFNQVNLRQVEASSEVKTENIDRKAASRNLAAFLRSRPQKQALMG